MNFKRLTYLIFVLLSLEGVGQNFYRTYGNNDDEIGRSVIETKDTCYFIFGVSSSFYEGNSNFYLIKIDSLGNFLWSKVYGGNNIDQGYCIGLKPNGHFLLTGFSNSYGGGYNLLNIEIDSLGNVIWHKTHGGNDWDFAYDNTILPNGNTIITGATYSAGNGNQDGFLMELDNNGDSLWLKTVGYSNEDVLKRTILTSDNYLVSIGYTTNTNGNTDIYLVKSHLNGDTLWTKSFGTSLNDEGMEIKETPAGGYLIGGFIEATGLGKEGYYFETDTAGNMLWSQVYGGSNDESFNCMAIRNGQSRFYAARETSSYGDGEFDFGVKCLNLPGGWYNAGNTYGTVMTEKPYDMIFTSHHRVLTVGYSDFPYDNYNVMAVMTDTLFQQILPINTFIDANSINEESILISSEFYPNPANDFVYVTPDLFFEVEIYDITGKIMAHQNCRNGIVSTSDLPEGMYIFRFNDDSKSTKIARILIIH